MYQQPFSRSTPGCIIFLIDRSDSMRATFGDSGMTLAEGAARAVNKILLELCVKSTKALGQPLREYFFAGAYGYGLCPSSGQEGVESALPGALATRGIVPLPELADNPIASRSDSSVDPVAGRSRLPEWIVPVWGQRTPMCQAIDLVGAHVNHWANHFRDSHPPIIINITDGMVTDSPYRGQTLEQWANQLTSIQTSDGSALLFNVFLSPSRANGVWFPTEGTTLPEPGPELFSISSTLPQKIIDNARGAQIDVRPGSRGLVFNADLSMLVKFLEIGTRFDVRDR